MWRPAALLVLFSVGCSDPPPPPPTSVAPPPPPPTSVAPPPEQPTWLYRVTTDAQPSYVFAALEPGSPLYESFPADYRPLFTMAREVIVTDATTPEEGQALLLDTGVDRSGALDRTLGAERFALLAGEVDDVVPGPVIRFLRPVWAIQLLESSALARAAGMSTSDERLSPLHDAVSRRRMASRDVMPLLTSAEIGTMLAHLAPVATDALRAELDHREQDEQDARRLLEAYRAGDEAALLGIDAEPPLPGHERYSTISRDDMSAAIDRDVPTLEAELRQGNALVLLPLQWVLGEHGLLARLRADGLEVARISVAAPLP